jgi:hypothetical protein
MIRLSLPIVLAWRPLLDPMPIDAYWLWLLAPMVVAVAVIYKAIKIDDLAQLPRQAASLAIQFVVLMALAAAALWLLSELA